MLVKLLYKSFLGIALMGAVFFLCNWIYQKTGDWQETVKSVDEKGLYERLKQEAGYSDVFYFAESSNASIAPGDSTAKSISELTNDCFPHLKITAIEKGALHAGVYKNLIRLIPDHAKVKTIVVTMNLRSFNNDWINSDMENHCQQLKILYNENPPLYNKMRLVFKMYDYKEDWERLEDYRSAMKTTQLYAPFPLKFKTVKEWDGYMFHHPYLSSDGSPDMPKVELACHNIKSFAFNIDTLENPRVKDFDEIVEICKEKNIKLYFTILPENTQYADSLVGKELVEMMRINKALLMNRYSKKGAIMIDNLELVEGIDYIDQRWTSEHYNQRGRTRIAKNIANSLKQQFSSQYKECPY